MRFVRVFVDGENRGQLTFGQSLSLELEPGRHMFLFDNTWAKKSMELDLTPGETRALVVGNQPGGCFVAGLAFAGAGPTHVFIEEQG